MLNNRIKPIRMEDAYMLESLVNTINELIDENEYLHKRINRLWKFIRMRKLGEKEKDDDEPKRTQ